jgi:D-alanine-D-alanine ligase
MKVGMTYDLRADYLAEGYSEEETAEFDRPDTIDAIEQALVALGHSVVRIGNIKRLVARLAAGERWDLVFNICEGLHGYGREAQVPALLEAYSIPCTFSDALTLSLSLHKGMTKHVIRGAGIATPDFAVVERPEDVASIDLPYPLFVKPVAGGTGQGVTTASRCANRSELTAQCTAGLTQYKQAQLVETYLSGREFTVGIVGTGPRAQSVGVLEIVLRDKAEKEVYSYTNKEFCEELVEYVLVSDAVAKDAARVALASWIALGCRDAGRVDVRANGAGEMNFIEVNPIAGLHPHHSDLPMICTKSGIAYMELIGRIVEEASRRISTR